MSEYTGKTIKILACMLKPGDVVRVNLANSPLENPIYHWLRIDEIEEMPEDRLLLHYKNSFMTHNISVITQVTTQAEV